MKADDAQHDFGGNHDANDHHEEDQQLLGHQVDDNGEEMITQQRRKCFSFFFTPFLCVCHKISLLFDLLDLKILICWILFVNTMAPRGIDVSMLGSRSIKPSAASNIPLDYDIIDKDEQSLGCLPPISCSVWTNMMFVVPVVSRFPDYTVIFTSYLKDWSLSNLTRMNLFPHLYHCQRLCCGIDSSFSLLIPSGSHP